MKGSIFIFTRHITTDSGLRYVQGANIYAQDQPSAQNKLQDILSEIREGSPSDAPPFYEQSPEWTVTELPLDKEPMLVSLAITTFS